MGVQEGDQVGVLVGVPVGVRRVPDVPMGVPDDPRHPLGIQAVPVHYRSLFIFDDLMKNATKSCDCTHNGLIMDQLFPS